MHDLFMYISWINDFWFLISDFWPIFYSYHLAFNEEAGQGVPFNSHQGKIKIVAKPDEYRIC